MKSNIYYEFKQVVQINLSIGTSKTSLSCRVTILCDVFFCFLILFFIIIFLFSAVVLHTLLRAMDDLAAIFFRSFLFVIFRLRAFRPQTFPNKSTQHLMSQAKQLFFMNEQKLLVPWSHSPHFHVQISYSMVDDIIGHFRIIWKLFPLFLAFGFHPRRLFQFCGFIYKAFYDFTCQEKRKKEELIILTDDIGRNSLLFHKESLALIEEKSSRLR